MRSQDRDSNDRETEMQFLVTLTAWATRWFAAAAALLSLRLGLLCPEVVPGRLVGSSGKASDHGTMVGAAHSCSARGRGLAAAAAVVAAAGRGLVVGILKVRIEVDAESEAACAPHRLEHDRLSAAVSSARSGASAAHLLLLLLLRGAAARRRGASHRTAAGEEGRTASWAFFGHVGCLLCGRVSVCGVSV